ncbi:MAG TPA: EAL domain-containing protein [Rhodoferax sp.]|nr:EAL domain-containing protein [Rhodoferax sp.]
MSTKSGYRVMVVDDRPENIYLMQAILSPAGYEVVVTTSGEAALRLAQASAPDLILLDVLMPEMDGYAVCSRLKQMEVTRQIPVIFVTAVDDTEAEARSFALGAADYITKPVKLSRVLARVKTHIALYRQQQSLQGMFHDVIELAPDAMLLSDAQGQIVRINAQAEQLFGYTRQELVGQAIEVLLPKHLREKHPVLRDGFTTAPMARRMSSDVQARRKDGSNCEVAVTLNQIQTADDALIVSAFRDIGWRKAAETDLRIAAAAFESQDGVVVTDLDDMILRSNQAFSRISGYSAEEALGRKMNFLKSDRHGDDFYRAMWQAVIQDGVWHGEIWNRHKSGEVHPHWLTISAVKDAQGQVTHYVGTYTDYTERHAAEEQLRIAAVAFESQECMMVTDANKVILRVNRAFADVTGFSPEELVGQTPRMLQSGRHDEDFYRDMTESIDRTGGWQGEIWDRHKNGEVFPKWLSISAVKDAGGAVTHFVSAQHDISERKKTEATINQLAFFDPLTSLPNRTLLLDRLKQAITASVRSQHYGALLFIDLDHFKDLNDSLGHDVGDLLLKQVAQRLSFCVREGDTVARLGGDEFVVLLVNLSTSATEAAIDAEVVTRKIIATLDQVYRFGGSPHHSTASIGLTFFQGAQVSLDELLKQADLSMYKAKADGRNTYRFFDPAMEVAVKKRSALEADLRWAVEAQQLYLHYQPQVTQDGQVGHVTGSEVLLRWRHPQRGMVSPADFIDLAEETGLILPLGHWVLESACHQLAVWANVPALAHLTVAVNVSALQFAQADFVEQVMAVVQRTGANPLRLKLELTESLLVGNIADIIEKMVSLKSRGIDFSLDDFGTGYSSLSYLSRLPLNQLKIDRSFVSDVLINPDDAAIAKTIIALAHSLRLGVIAEGVETDAQREFLTGAGCHAYQGYLFSRPLPVAEFEAFVRSH